MATVGEYWRILRHRWTLMLLILGLVGMLPFSALAEGAALRMIPSSGEFEVGGLVDVSFIVDTGGEAINAVQADILFPADKLQVVNPVASTSFIASWVAPPTYSNTDGTLHFQGGLPNPGIKTSAGVISTVSFRIRAPGNATLRYASTSRVLRNDQNGTDILTSTGTAEFVLKIPPPAGPIVTSPTHPDPNVWYNNGQVQFHWDPVDNAQGYSYTFDQSSKAVPDETIDTTSTSASEVAPNDGVWYFHIRSKTESWGGVTTYPVQIDTTPPAAFTPKFDKNTVTVEDTPVLRFLTTDAASGIDHYEVKQLSLKTSSQQANTLFVEASSPYSVGKLPQGKVQFIVRAYDRAGNTVEGSTNLTVLAAGLPFYAQVPLLQNPAVANGVLVGLGVLATGLVTTVVVRRVRPRKTFQHDLAALERDARRKSEALKEELDELSAAKHIVEQEVGATDRPRVAGGASMAAHSPTPPKAPGA